ncbi:MAG: aldo/keto reductase [Opitutales bacterium]|nr:aldo/keto reductase [Opitutales bacterium]
MNSIQSFSRRDFLKTAIAGVAAGSAFIANSQEKKEGEVPTRILGRTGERVSAIGLGGWTIGRVEEKNAISIMHEAIDAGVTFFDNCWEYHDGWAEELMGKALATQGRRDKVYLMSKGCGRDADNAESQINDSLRRLDTDHMDLWLFHGVSIKEEIPRMLDDQKGALAAVLKAQKAGKIRHIGFSCHSPTDVALEILSSGFQFDSALIPLSILDAHFDSYQHKVLPILNEQNVGVLGMKSLSVGSIPSLGFDPKQARRYSLSLPISSLMCGIQSRDNLLQDLDMARNFIPMTEADVKPLLEKSANFAKEGKYERYKTSTVAGCRWQYEQDQASA